MLGGGPRNPAVPPLPWSCYGADNRCGGSGLRSSRSFLRRWPWSRLAAKLMVVFALLFTTHLLLSRRNQALASASAGRARSFFFPSGFYVNIYYFGARNARPRSSSAQMYTFAFFLPTSFIKSLSVATLCFLPLFFYLTGKIKWGQMRMLFFLSQKKSEQFSLFFPFCLSRCNSRKKKIESEPGRLLRLLSFLSLAPPLSPA